MTRRVAWIAAGIVLAVHALGNAHYGFFRDELYFIICGRHPQFGYVDQPPVVPLLAALSQIGGHSLWLLRIVPALFAAAGAYVTVLLVEEFGGGLFAQSLATIVFLFCNVLLSFGEKAGPDEVGLWTWPLIAYLVVRITKGADPRLWLVVGAVTGLSIQSKYSVLFFLVALVAGLLLTPQRSVLFNRWCAAATAIAALIALPNFLWQAAYHFPMLELLRNGQNGKNVVVGPLLYLAQEILITNLFLFGVWVIGAIWLLTRPNLRFLGYLYVVLIAEMMIFHGKHYYPADVYPIVIAAGAVPIEAWTSRTRPLRVAIVAYALLLGPLFVPFSLPILPEPVFVAYQARLYDLLHIPRSALATEHNRETSTLPGDWADMHGWPNMAATVLRVYQSLPPGERARAVVFGNNYGEASAVRFFAGIPAISTHNQYYLWGPDDYDGRVLVQIGGTCWSAERYFRSRTIAAVIHSPWAIAYENDIPVNVCRGLKIPVARLWAESKDYE
ncbi:MAG TPA: glycosyltransferase family 39 protein [Candidatus Acidoferrales bacterium]|nr:glycosyltransferase family 39 protein [Candidatus Acidoferrales bacterium]